MQGNIEIASNDLLIGDGGNDTLRSHRGDDVLIGGQGRDRMEGGEGRDTYVIEAGDTVMDSDGLGEVRWGGLALTGGARAASDPVDTYRSEDGRFIYALDNNTLSVTDTLASDPALRDPVVIENFRNGQLGITLVGPPTDPHRPNDQRHGRVVEEGHGPGSAGPSGPASAPDVSARSLTTSPSSFPDRQRVSAWRRWATSCWPSISEWTNSNEARHTRHRQCTCDAHHPRAGVQG